MYQVLGWVCAKAIHDARLLDLPFSTPLCHTLLDRPLERADLALICPDVYKTLQKLEGIVEQKKAILKDASMSGDAKVPSCLSLMWGGECSFGGENAHLGGRMLMWGGVLIWGEECSFGGENAHLGQRVLPT